LKTVKGISDFDIWLEKLHAQTRDLGFTEALGVVAQIARATYGVRLWFVEILGRRWSYIAGEHGNQPTTSSVIPFHLNERIAVLSDTWGCLPKRAQARLVAFLKNLARLKQHDDQSQADRKSP
jgi:hypothetical protein